MLDCDSDMQSKELAYLTPKGKENDIVFKMLFHTTNRWLSYKE